MVRLDLNGKWEFRRTGNWTAWTDAVVPGCVHTDLMAAGLIDDPFARLNELDLLWIDEAGWEYRRRFDASAAVRAERCQQLVFEGLDTIAEVWLNGRRVGRADNMFRRWVFDVTGRLRPRGNALRVVFTGPVAEARRLADARGRLPGGDYAWGTGRFRRTDRNQVRKAQYQFGWDWGPSLATCGIWRPVRLLAHSGPRVEYVTHRQRHTRSAVAIDLCVRVFSPAAAAGTMAVRLCGRERRVPFRVGRGAGRIETKLRVADPKLWWPAGMGDQPLYSLEVELLDAAGRPLDAATRRIGLRRVELVRRPDKVDGRDGETFFFRVNGRPVYAKGANWIPADVFPTRVARADYERLLRQAVGANMNMLRVWGGGIYEHDDFYDLCDELGLLVWHDQMFACAAYPAASDFLANVRAETVHQLRRLDSHPCIALWCGNNENEWGVGAWWARLPNAAALGRDYRRLTRTQERVTRAEAPDTPWWPSSPSTRGDLRDVNNLDVGDCHFWEVWHQRAPFERYLQVDPRFQSEFGFQSFPDAATLGPVLARGDWDLTSPAMEHHQRHGSGNAIICETMCRHFRLPQRPDEFFYVSQLLQATAVQMGVEHWRRIKPHCMGALYWQLNDCWPVASWSSMDSAGRAKALHHAARRFFAPLLISAVERDRKVELWITSDLPERLVGEWAVELWTYAGRRLERIARPFTLGADGSRRVARWPIKRFADGFDARGRVFLRLACRAGRHGAENFFFPAPLKRAELAQPKMAARVKRAGDGFAVTLAADAVALFVECRTGELIGDWSDNFVHLLPGRPRTLTFRPAPSAGRAGQLTTAAFRKALAVRSLRDSYD